MNPRREINFFQPRIFGWFSLITSLTSTFKVAYVEKLIPNIILPDGVENPPALVDLIAGAMQAISGANTCIDAVFEIVKVGVCSTFT